MAGPFKMKGSPFQRNFGIGSPLHQDVKPLNKEGEEQDLPVISEAERQKEKNMEALKGGEFTREEASKIASKGKLLPEVNIKGKKIKKELKKNKYTDKEIIGASREMKYMMHLHNKNLK